MELESLPTTNRMEDTAEDRNTRREFLKTSATGTGGLVLGVGYVKPFMQTVHLMSLTRPSGDDPGHGGNHGHGHGHG